MIAAGHWITSADDDDWLYPHSIDQRLEAIQGQRGALWSAGYCTDDCKFDPRIVPAGPSSPGDIWRAWPTPKASIPLGPTTLLMEANMHGGQMTKTTWFDDLELLSRRCAWERGQQILCEAQLKYAACS